MIPIYDDHLHLSPSGLNVEAAKQFQKAGGTGMTLVTLPFTEFVEISEGSDFLRTYEITLSMAEKVRESTDLKVNVAVGPYPVSLLWLKERFGLERAEDMMIEGMELAARLVSEGKVNALGEIGRPHFPVDDQSIIESSNRILLRGMELARELDCPVMIHCESEAGTFQSLAQIADEAGLDRGMVIKHSSPPMVTDDENLGIMPSIPASRTSIKEAIMKNDRFMLETDYIDDPQRPGSFMSITTVPKRINGYLQSGELTEENVYRICEDIPCSLYERRH